MPRPFVTSKAPKNLSRVIEVHDFLVVTVLKVLLIVALVALNAFFVASEYALLSVRRTRLEQLAQEGDDALGCCNRFSPMSACCFQEPNWASPWAAC
jgi:hypothetical protein